jgi:hypothetical protein
MNWDILLHWMTHLGEGSWGGFKDAVARLAGEDAEPNDLVVALRFHLSDLGHVDFFTGGSRRWRVLSPILAGLTQSDAAILCGGRTPRLHETLVAAAHRADCLVSSEDTDGRPTILRIAGTPPSLVTVATEAGVTYTWDYATSLCAELRPVFKVFEELREEPSPTNWSVKSFDFDSMTMIDGLRRNSACEYSPRHGMPRWYVHTRHGRLKPMPKREAIYTAAMLRGVGLLSYDSVRSRLLVRATTPPPESYSRVACLCSGRRPRVSDGLLVFEEVPPTTAAILCVAAGQSYPALSDSGASATGDRNG